MYTPIRLSSQVNTSPAELALILAFSVGVLCQAFAMLSQAMALKLRTISISLIFLASFLFALLGFTKSTGYDFNIHLFSTICMFIFFYSLAFFSVILPTVTARLLVIYNAVFLYYLLMNSCQVWMYLLPSFALFINCFVNIDRPAKVKVLLYFCYLYMSATILWLIIASGYHDVSFVEQFSSPVSLQSLVSFSVLGMLCLCLATDVMHIMLPIYYVYILYWSRGSRDRKLAGKKGLNHYINSISIKYDENKQDPVDTLLLMGAIASILLSNYYFSYISDLLLVNIILLTSRYLSDKKLI